MPTIQFKGAPIKLSGNIPAKGEKAPPFSLTKTDLSTLTLESLKGKKVLLNVFPSIDTSVCSTSARRFNEAVQQKKNCVIVCVSMDLPFAHKRFCEAEPVLHVIPASDFQEHRFAKDYGLRMEDGPLKGLLARGVFVLDEQGTIIYTELVPELTHEPNYAEALKALE